MRRFVLFIMCALLVTACANAGAPATPTTKSLPTNSASPTPHEETQTPIAKQPSPTSMPDSPTATPQGVPAPQIKSDTWINSQPLAWESLRGKVVLVEFWTFDCINCRHVIPYLKEMDADYRDQGFTIIGVHSPEFKHEQDLSNVRDAVKDMGIRYPVALDNDFANWNRYNNLAWPALYLVDKQGFIRYTHIGEGAYDETRQWIEQLLEES